MGLTKASTYRTRPRFVATARRAVSSAKSCGKSIGRRIYLNLMLGFLSGVYLVSRRLCTPDFVCYAAKRVVVGSFVSCVAGKTPEIYTSGECCRQLQRCKYPRQRVANIPYLFGLMEQCTRGPSEHAREDASSGISSREQNVRQPVSCEHRNASLGHIPYIRWD